MIYLTDLAQKTRKRFPMKDEERPLYIFDLDGTLALIDHRRPILEDYSNSKRWDDFYEACDKDEPNLNVIEIFNELIDTDRIDCWVFSGRSSKVESKTIDWLELHTGWHHHEHVLMMRNAFDSTPDEVLKRKWYENMLSVDKERLVCVFDDRNKVVKMWRSIGVTCLQVAPGDF